MSIETISRFYNLVILDFLKMLIKSLYKHKLVCGFNKMFSIMYTILGNHFSTILVLTCMIARNALNDTKTIDSFGFVLCQRYYMYVKMNLEQLTPRDLHLYFSQHHNSISYYDVISYYKLVSKL